MRVSNQSIALTVPLSNDGQCGVQNSDCHTLNVVRARYSKRDALVAHGHIKQSVTAAIEARHDIT